MILLARTFLQYLAFEILRFSDYYVNHYILQILIDLSIVTDRIQESNYGFWMKIAINDLSVRERPCCKIHCT